MKESQSVAVEIFPIFGEAAATRSADPSPSHSSVSGAPGFAAIQIAAIGAQALE